MSTLKAWVERRAPHLLASLADPITDEVLTKTETLFGRALPADFVAFLREHDGQRFMPQNEAVGSLAALFHGVELLGAKFCVGEWEAMREWGEGYGDMQSDGPVRPLYEHEAWWPFTTIYGASHHHCLDLDPAPGGDVGQVIVVSMKDDRRTVIAPSFGDFMDRLLAILDDSPVVVDEHGIALPDEAVAWLLGA